MDDKCTVCVRIVGYLKCSSPQVSWSDSLPLPRTNKVHPLNLKKLNYGFTTMSAGLLCATASLAEYSE